MLSPPPHCVFVAPIAIVGTWGPCIVGRFPLISLESIQLLWFYSEVSAFCMYDFLRLNSLSQKTVPVWLWTALPQELLTGAWSGHCARPWVPSQASSLLPLPLPSLPLPQWHHHPHLAIPLKKRTRFVLVQLEKNEMLPREPMQSSHKNNSYLLFQQRMWKWF